MLSDVFTTEKIYKCLWDGVQPLIPYVLSIIIGGVMATIIKTFIGNMTYDFSRLSGNGKRIAKRDAKRAKNIIEIVTTIKDIKDK